MPNKPPPFVKGKGKGNDENKEKAILRRLEAMSNKKSKGKGGKKDEKEKVGGGY